MFILFANIRRNHSKLRMALEAMAHWVDAEGIPLHMHAIGLDQHGKAGRTEAGVAFAGSEDYKIALRINPGPSGKRSARVLTRGRNKESVIKRLDLQRGIHRGPATFVDGGNDHGLGRFRIVQLVCGFASRLPLGTFVQTAAGKLRHDPIGSKPLPRWTHLTVCGRLPSTGNVELATLLLFLAHKGSWE